MNNEIIEELLVKLSLISRKLTHTETQNIIRDLSLILSFIDSGEYRSTELFNRNRFDTQKRSYEFLSYIQGFYQQAKDWHELMQFIPFERISSILDIGPGFSPKIELALKLLGYKEKLTVLDKSPTALSGLRDFLYMIDFSYELNTICDDLFAVKNLYFNLVTANHLFDDLLIDAYCSLKQISPEYLYESEKGLIEATFEISQTYDMTSLICRTSCVLSQLVEENGFLLLRHYQGLTEKALGLNSWFEFVNLFFINVIDELQRGEFSIIQSKNGFVLLKKNNSFKKDSL